MGCFGGLFFGLAIGILIERIYKHNDVRQSSLNWWNSLTCQEKLDIENDFFESSEKGEITDIDIEVMYKTYVDK